MMLRLGAVGAQSSHLAHFARELNGDARIVRVLPIDAHVSAVPAGLEVSHGFGRFADGLDGVLIFTRDGRNHAKQAAPFLSTGLPVFVDKPLACNVDDAQTILAAGRVTSFSALRFLPDVRSLRASGAAIRQIRVPADGADPNAGFWFHGIHGAELACAAVGPCQVHSVTMDGSTLIAVLHAPSQSFELVLNPSATTYEIEHSGGTINLDTGAAYGLAARELERFFTEEPGLSAEEMLAPIELLEQVLSITQAPPQPSLIDAT